MTTSTAGDAWPGHQNPEAAAPGAPDLGAGMLRSPPPRQRRLARSILRCTVALAVLCALAAGVANEKQSGFDILTPGPLFDLGTEMSGPGLNPDLAHEHFYLTTVNVEPLSWFGYAKYELFGGGDLEQSSPLPTGVSQSAVAVSENGLMGAAQAAGITVGTAEVRGHSPLSADGAQVLLVESGRSAARAGLHVSDRITSVNGEAVQTDTEFSAALDQAGVNTTLTLGVARHAQSLDVVIRNYAGAGSLGVEVVTALDGQSPYSFDVPGVGGPSGGLMLALTTTAALTQGNLAGHNVVAGTGTIEPDGVVGSISGADQKILSAIAGGATVFFAPKADYQEAQGAAGGRIEVVAVGTYNDALSWLCHHGATASVCSSSPAR